MIKHVLKTLVAVLAIAAAATGPARAQSTSQVTDVMNREWTGRSGPSFGDWSGLTLTSDAVYAGLTAGGNNAIQLRSSNQNSGIVTTTSGGTVASVTVTWNSNTPSGRTLKVYGKHSAYSSATELFNDDNAGDLLGTIVYGTSTPLTIEGDYEYIGLRSQSGALYLDEIQVVWNVAGSATPEPEPEPTTTNRTLTGVPQGWTVQAGDPLTGVQPDADGSYSIEAGQPVLLVPSAEDKPRVKSVTLTEVVSLATPLTMEALTAGTIVVSSPESGMQYSLNGGAKTAMSATTTITVAAGDKVAFYGNGNSITQYYTSFSNYTKIAGGTAQVKVYGNIMSLVDEENFATGTTLSSNNAFRGLFDGNGSLTDASGLLLPATTLTEACYGDMFYGCTALTAAPALPATTLATYCYEGMFYGCTALTAAPALPATTLATYCYNSMFGNCYALTAAPELPATTLAQGCYYYMFYSCYALTAAPELPATTLAESCYSYMFQNCSALTAAPELPATTLALNCYGYMFNGCSNLATGPTLPAATLVQQCYTNMFNGCSNLSSVTCLATDISASSCLNNWLQGAGTNVNGTKTFTAAAETEWPEGVSGILEGWTRLNPDGSEWVAPNRIPLTLEATTAGTIVVNSPKSGMQYSKNGGAKTAMNATTTINVAAGDKVAFYGNGTSITQYFTSNSNYTKIAGGTAKVKVYGNIMSLVDEENFATATTLSDYAFRKLFDGNATLTDASELLLPATTLAQTCYGGMFMNCSTLVAAPALPATTLASYCYNSMFGNCTALTTAPELPATTLVHYCYFQMFYNCSKLSSVTCLATSIDATNCITNWLQNAGTNAATKTLHVKASMGTASWYNENFTVTPDQP